MSAVDVAPRFVAPTGLSTSRRLAVSWQHPSTRQISPIALLEFDGSRYSFGYVRNAEAVVGFRPLLGFPNLRRTYQSTYLFPLFAQRVMDPRRPDHARYIRRLGLPDDADPWEQMSRSGGRREGDLLQLLPEPLVGSDGLVVCRFLVHGVRHIAGAPLRLGGIDYQVTTEALDDRLRSLTPGEPLRFVREPGNRTNGAALVVTTEDGFPLGWAPDLLLGDLYAMSADAPDTIDLRVEQSNGPEAPPHLRLLSRLSALAVENYRPFGDPGWDLLAGSGRSDQGQ